MSSTPPPTEQSSLSQQAEDASSACWREEELYFNRAYFEALFREIDRAQQSVSVETYIFEQDEIGARLLEHLQMACDRGVRVRLILDGIGSRAWIYEYIEKMQSSQLQLRVYHPVPWPLSKIMTQRAFEIGKLLNSLSNLNRRNHRKLCLIDNEICFTGSANFHSPEPSWEEVGVRVQGNAVKVIGASFETIWDRAFNLKWKKPDDTPLQATLTTPPPLPAQLRLNHRPNYRKLCHRRLLDRIKSAVTEITIVTPYFVPTARLMTALIAAKKRGVRVRLIVPQNLDVSFMKWVGYTFVRQLLKAEVEVYQFQPAFLHAKILVIDDWAMIGSSNINRRSLLRDLEVDIVLTQRQNLIRLKSQVERWKKQSSPLRLEGLQKVSLWSWLKARLALLIKDWL